MVSHDSLPNIDTSVAHSARIYDYWLGGKDNFESDRAVGDAMIQAIPTLPTMARANREFLGRAVRYLAGEAGIRQFLDIGTGIPTAGNVHEVAQQVAPDTRVLYVDHDPIVLAHARALMTGTSQGRTEFLMADLREPEEILSSPEFARTLNLAEPVALMLVAILMYFDDAEGVHEWVATLVDALPSGSYVTVTHPTADFEPAAFAAAANAAASGGITLVPRTKEEIGRFLTGLTLVEPGIVPMLTWHPDEEPADPNAAWYWAAMAHKP